MNVDMLNKLADFLDDLPRHRFNYMEWVGFDWAGKPDMSCGTTACALGWACVLFPDQLSMSQEARSPEYALQHGRHAYGARAACYAFGLSDHQASFLFLPVRGEDFATPRYVAAKIRYLIASHGRVVGDWSVADKIKLYAD